MVSQGSVFAKKCTACTVVVATVVGSVAMFALAEHRGHVHARMRGTTSLTDAFRIQSIGGNDSSSSMRTAVNGCRPPTPRNSLMPWEIVNSDFINFDASNLDAPDVDVTTDRASNESYTRSLFNAEDLDFDVATLKLKKGCAATTGSRRQFSNYSVEDVDVESMQFVTFKGNYGRWSNRIIQIERLIELGAHLRRHVIIPEDEFWENITSLVDFRLLEQELNALARHPDSRLRIFVPGQLDGMPKEPSTTTYAKSQAPCVAFTRTDSNMVHTFGVSTLHWMEGCFPSGGVFVPFDVEAIRRVWTYVDAELQTRCQSQGKPRCATVGVHLRLQDLSNAFSFPQFLDFVEAQAKKWNASTFFLATNGKASEVQQFTDRFPHTHVGTSALCKQSEDNCIVYDQIALSKTDYFLGSLQYSTFTQQVQKMRRFYHGQQFNESRHAIYSYARMNERKYPPKRFCDGTCCCSARPWNGT